ncbi:hypothetical protein Vretifemale_17566 [Volvox reticuliferus]|uniref:Protein kinase domain-containing protein n=1 Tax=Volvox reticuliferus TaxID=1737510 RepID=A0A8J4CXV7_9CHLO|nr:hypothetical protein Vretifemale_17566 [Volvox reticuliferus]
MERRTRIPLAPKNTTAAITLPPPTPQPPQPRTPSPPSSTSPHSLQLFKGAANAVKLTLTASHGFTTLRDMGGVQVQPGSLQIIRKLGEGAFAVVEEAQYTPGTPGEVAGEKCIGSGRRVAVKRLKPGIVTQQGSLESFVAETTLMRKLAHKRIVEFIGVGSFDSSSEEATRRTMFLVQEFMDGGTLKRLISRQMIDVSRQLYSYMDAFRWALQIAEGLEYLHNAQPVVIHRDLKLENILIKGGDLHTADVKIADFGLVALLRPRDRGLHKRLVQEVIANPLQPVTRSSFGRLISVRKQPQTIQEFWDQSYRLALTNRWRVSPAPQQLSGRTGSYMYMAPEMYREEQYNEKVDVFSYGVMVFEILSRYQMVCAVSVAGTEAEIEAYAAKVSEGYRPPLPPACPPPVRELIAMCWHQDASLRPSMSWVKERLMQMQAEGVPAEMQDRIVPPSGCGCTVM